MFKFGSGDAKQEESPWRLMSLHREHERTIIKSRVWSQEKANDWMDCGGYRPIFQVKVLLIATFFDDWTLC
jgi:hypothetical protein